MMKVTFCAYDRPNNLAGGPNAWLRRLLPSLKSKGVHVKVLFIITQGEVSECITINAIKESGINYEYIYWKDYPYTEDKIKWILQSINSDPPDIFVPNLMVPAYYASKWIRKAGIPTIGILHSDDSFHHALIDEFVSGSKDHALTAMVAVSKILEKQVSGRNNNLLIARVPYGSIIPFTIAKEPSFSLRIIYAGRLVEPQKRIKALTQSFCNVVKNIPGTEAIIYGNGPESESINEIIKANGENLPVKLGGAIDNSNMQEVMSQAHVFVLLSDYEGLPIALMEAMACGLVPVCLREKSGIEELIQNNENGLIVEDRDYSFINAIRRLKQEDNLWKKLSINARKTIENDYSHEHGVDKWLNLFHRLTSESSSFKKIKIPNRILLPPIHPGLAREDNRAAVKKKISYLKKIKNKLRLRVRFNNLLELFINKE